RRGAGMRPPGRRLRSPPASPGEPSAGCLKGGALMPMELRDAQRRPGVRVAGCRRSRIEMELERLDGDAPPARPTSRWLTLPAEVSAHDIAVNLPGDRARLTSTTRSPRADRPRPLCRGRLAGSTAAARRAP